MHGEYGAHEYMCACGTQITVCMYAWRCMYIGCASVYACEHICMVHTVCVWVMICRSHVQACSLGLLCLCTHEHASPCVCCRGWYWFRCGKCRCMQVGACRGRMCGSECVDLYMGL